MDLLEQYKQQNPGAFQREKSQAPQDPYGYEYGGMVRFVMRLSGGRIRDAKQASYALLGIAIVCALGGILLFTGIPGTSAPTQPNTINP